MGNLKLLKRKFARGGSAVPDDPEYYYKKNNTSFGNNHHRSDYHHEKERFGIHNDLQYDNDNHNEGQVYDFDNIQKETIKKIKVIQNNPDLSNRQKEKIIDLLEQKILQMIKRSVARGLKPVDERDVPSDIIDEDYLE